MQDDVDKKVQDYAMLEHIRLKVQASALLLEEAIQHTRKSATWLAEPADLTVLQALLAIEERVRHAVEATE